MTCYVIKASDGKFIGIDDNSGGYPWHVSENALAPHVKVWFGESGLNDLKRYCKVCEKDAAREGWQVFAITYRLESRNF